MKTFAQSWQSILRSQKNILNAIALFCCIQLVSGLASADQLIDEENGKPLEGAFVNVSWTSGGPSVASSHVVCYALEVTKTDIEGQFSMPIFSWNFNPLLWQRHKATEFYLKGYETSPSDQPDASVRKMRKYKGAVGERLKHMTSILYRESCVPDQERRNKLGPLYLAQYEEGKNLASTASDDAYVALLKRRWESAILPYDSEHRNSDGTLK